MSIEEHIEYIGERIRVRRKEMGMTQEELADVLTLKKGTISYYENGGINIGVDKLLSIANALTTSIAYLVGEEPEMEREEIMQAVRLLRGIKNEELLVMAIEQLKAVAKADRLLA